MPSVASVPAPPAAWGGKRYNSYNRYLRNRFGTKVHKVSLHGGFTCPNRDGSKGFGGCIYCNNDSFVPSYIDADMEIRKQIAVSLPFMQKRYGAAATIAYFQAYTNTYADLDRLKELYGQALEHEGMVGLDIGTRADCIDEALLEYLAELNERHEVTVEFGIESCHDDTLEWMNRGHDYDAVVKAVALTRSYGLKVGGHLILGFPVEDREMMIESGLSANLLKLDFLKFHQLHIVKGTKLAHDFQQNPFPAFSPEIYIDLVIDILERLSSNIVMQRFFGDSPADLLIAPRWDRTIPELLYQLDQRLVERDTWQGRLFQLPGG